MSQIDPAEHIGLAIKMAKRVKDAPMCVGVDWDDIVGMCYLGLCIAANKYDSSMECQFSTYAYHTIWGTVSNECRRRYSSFDNVLYLEDAADHGSWEDFMRSDNPEKIVIEKLRYEEVINKLNTIIANLPPRQQEIMRTSLQNPDVSQATVGKMLGLTSSRVAQIHREVKKQLIAALTA